MLSLGMIVRNEARTIEVAIKSALPFVDEVIIAYAGESTDDTKKIVEDIQKSAIENGRKFVTFDFEWVDDFSAARNAVLARVTEPYFLWLDGDDVLVGGEHLRGWIERFPESPAFYMGYDYARDEEGNNTCYLIRERVVNLKYDWHWIGAIHEVLSTGEEVIPQSAKLPDVWVRHERPAKDDAGRNLSILYTQLEAGEPNPDPRILAYLGSENAGRGNLTEAILHWQRFVRLTGWDEEKYQCQVKIADAQRQLGDSARAVGSAIQAVEMKPDWPDAYLSLARTYMLGGKYNVALEWLKVAVSKPRPETMLIINPMEYTYAASVMIAVCYTQLRDWEMALQNYEASYLLKQDADVANQILLLRQELDNQEVVKSFLKVREHLGRHDEWLKVRLLFDAMPKMLQKHPEVQAAMQRTLVQTQHIGNQELMLEHYRTNPHWVPMSDETILDPEWLKYPRLRFAIDVAEKVDAKHIIDWGCSDGFISLPLARETGATLLGIDADPRCTNLAAQRALAWGIDANFREGAVGENIDLEETADLALLFEVIEHVDDPEETLEAIERKAHHIALTTPYLAWENGNIPNWDTEEMKGHLRIFDLDDMEVLLRPRGHISNLYREPWGNGGWIFADYTPGKQLEGPSIAIGAMAGAESWGPRKYRDSGLGGSETAVIRVGEELARLGARVISYTPIDEPGIYNDVTYRSPDRFYPSVRSDLFIAWRWPEAADLGINTGRLILWMHDTDSGDRLTRDRAERFDYIVCLTEWHREFLLKRYEFLDESKLVVIPNGVDVKRFNDRVKKDHFKVVYSSSPDRGLDIILEGIWPKVIEQVPEAELHVYYGWNNYDAFQDSYPHMREFRQRVNDLFLNSKNVVQHGRIPQDRLAGEFLEASIWLYPTYFHETYCITAVEAQLAGAIPVTNHLAGLSETVASGAIIEGDVHDPVVQAEYAKVVIDTLKKSEKELGKYRQQVVENAPVESWASVARSFAKLVGDGEWLRLSTLSSARTAASWKIPGTQENGTSPLPVETAERESSTTSIPG
jgi:glycosyltransferase involved in cell wall biosynthesis/tetratricopeptide (TPR) repeat protein